MIAHLVRSEKNFIKKFIKMLLIFLQFVLLNKTIV